MTDPAGSAAGRVLIVNGDDFGRTPGINSGIIRAHEHGILTSASLMVRWPAAEQAAAYCRERSDLSVGLHLDLGEWVFTDGQWQRLYEVVPTTDAAAVRREVAAQVQAFRRLLGRDPTHLDSHQHVHLQEPVRAALLDEGRALGAPTRACSVDVGYCGDFYGQTGTGEAWPDGITVEALVRIIGALGPGVTELSCHPGEGDDFDSVYRVERTQEVSVLCHPAARRAIAAAAVQLAPFPPVTGQG